MIFFIRRLSLIAIIAAIVVVPLSCSKGGSSKKLVKKGLFQCEERLQTAAHRMERRGFNDAIRILEEIKYQCGGIPLMDTVYYYTGMSHFRLRQYENARFEFEILYREFPRSPFVEEAHFRIAHMRYIQSLPSFRDQTDTKEAIRLLLDYLDLFPRGNFSDSAKAMYASALNKLAEKEFNNARFYRRQRKHEAALIYYRAVLSDYPESKFVPEAIVGMAEMLMALGRTQDAQEVVEELDTEAFEERLKTRINAVKRML
ncbi:MAG: outer membrane protein assembly factor BamD [Chitinispirillales bacterium]|jgi:outer membrane assembly lipoprotein YfiO|nr:outer membrane protein assembly factor BamD [Chitinispirillales bacterium]